MSDRCSYCGTAYEADYDIPRPHTLVACREYIKAALNASHREERKLRARVAQLEAALREILELAHLCDSEHSPRSCGGCVVVENARAALAGKGDEDG